VPALSAHNSTVSLPAEAQNQLKKHIEELGGYASEDVAKALNFSGTSGHGKSKPHLGSTHTSRPNSGAGDTPSGQEVFTGPGQPPGWPDGGLCLPNKGPSEQIGVWVFIDIQLYMLETNTYMVDFKCDGYQNVVLVDPSKERNKNPLGNGSTLTSPISSRPSSGFEQMRSKDSLDGMYELGRNADQREILEPYWKPTTKRYKNKEKEISSPYPYLDVASDLIAQLAS
jgi:hypothetical protein